MADETPDQSETPTLKENIKAGSTWMRGLFMVLFIIIYGIAEFLIFAVILFQFLSMLVARKTNEPLLGFSKSLSMFIYEIMIYLSYNDEQRPFPFGTWPSDADKEPTGAAVADG
ncbi:MAG: DUF4389 domain-containing protein [Alphaproteobacteria bacterium]|nr:DUF4389 domain-containing protein [Alphaproteobacteria bacterium]MCZ6764630.1 DUF4389 domain-containing protein [Alphaproteobacteria bacterium]